MLPQPPCSHPPELPPHWSNGSSHHDPFQACLPLSSWKLLWIWQRGYRDSKSPTTPPPTSNHTPSTSTFCDGRALRLAVDPDLALTVGAWDLGLVFDPVPWIEGWRFVEALGSVGVVQDQVPCWSTGTSSGNCQQTQTCMVLACHSPRQPLQKHSSMHFGGWVPPWSAEKMLDGQHPAHARTAHNGLLQKRLEDVLCWIVCQIGQGTEPNCTIAVCPLTRRTEHLHIVLCCPIWSFCLTHCVLILFYVWFSELVTVHYGPINKIKREILLSLIVEYQYAFIVGRYDLVVFSVDCIIILNCEPDFCSCVFVSWTGKTMKMFFSC